VHSLPGGKFAPPPPVSRIVVGGVALVATAVFGFVWAMAGVLNTLTTKAQSEAIVGHMLVGPTAAALVQTAQQHPDAARLTYADDLVAFDIDRSAARDINIATPLATQRAAQLWTSGMPKDPILERTRTQFPRQVVELFTRRRHDQMKPAMLAALFGVAAGMLICVLMATGAARFGVPGTAALLAYLLLRYHIFLFRFWIDRNVTDPFVYQVRVRDAVLDPQRKLLFVAIALLVAGFVYSALLGGTRAVVRERRAFKARQEAAKRSKRADRKAARRAGQPDAAPVAAPVAPVEQASSPGADDVVDRAPDESAADNAPAADEVPG